MKTRATLFAAALALSAAFAGSAAADEVWVMPSGNQLVYDRDVGNVAVLTYQAEQGRERGQIFVVGLGGRGEGRGRYEAYWVEADDAGAACPASLVDAEGRTWRRWGIASASFASPSFPSRLTVTRSACLNPAVTRVTARPVVGAGVR